VAGILVLGLAIAALLPAAYRMARPFLTAFVLAAILAVVLDPVQKRASRLVARSSVAALLTTVAGMGPIVCVILLAGIAINRQIKSGAFAGILSAGERLTATAHSIARPLFRKRSQNSATSEACFSRLLWRWYFCMCSCYADKAG
jgi:predicted PurR-regulated permease PerM